MDASWVLDIRDQCQKAGTPFFFKQWGGKNKKKTGRLLEDRTWDEMPVRRGLSQDLRAASFRP
jgi:protein gp37